MCPSGDPLPADARTRARLRRMEKRVRKGSKIFVEGDPPGKMYILLSGSLTITRKGVKIAVITEPGAYVGEMSVLLGEARTATVTAERDCRMLAVPEADILEFLTHAPDLALKLAKILASRLKQTNDRFAEYRRAMTERYSNLNDRIYRIYTLNKNPRRTSGAEISSELQDAIIYLSKLKPLGGEKKMDIVL